MPASRHFATSSRKTLAVMATMGTFFAWGTSRARMRLVASYPSTSGICTSMKIMSYLSGASP